MDWRFSNSYVLLCLSMDLMYRKDFEWLLLLIVYQNDSNTFFFFVVANILFSWINFQLRKSKKELCQCHRKIKRQKLYQKYIWKLQKKMLNKLWLNLFLSWLSETLMKHWIKEYNFFLHILLQLFFFSLLTKTFYININCSWNITIIFDC